MVSLEIVGGSLVSPRTYGKSTRAAQHSFSGNLASAVAVMMNLDRLCILVERLRKEAIGEPKMIAEKEAYEYQDHSAKVVAVLKLVRAAHGVNAMNLLCRSGLFIDFGAIVWCVYDCTEEVYFLLEEFPKSSGNVDKFVKSFFENTIDGYLSNETPSVPTKKIRSAAVRNLSGVPSSKERQMRIEHVALATNSVLPTRGGPAPAPRPLSSCLPSSAT
jgi:hypothetical protein